MSEQQQPKRSRGRPKGSGTKGHHVQVALKVDPALKALVDRSADEQGITSTEWWRRAALAYLQGAKE